MVSKRETGNYAFNNGNNTTYRTGLQILNFLLFIPGNLPEYKICLLL